MKSRVVPIATMIAVLAAPAVAQVADTPGVGAGTIAQPAPAFPDPAPAHDPDVEVAFWETVKDSGDPLLYLAYLEQFPQGAFRVIARNRLEELWDRAIRAFALLNEMGVSLDDPPGGLLPPVTSPVTTPVTTQNPAPGPVVVNPPVVVYPTPKPPPQAPSWQLIRNTQNQLSKHGCYKGRIDGVWGAGSQAAMKRFNRRAGTSYSVLRPTSKAVNHMRGLSKSNVRICR